MDRYEAESILVEIQALHFFINESVGQLADLATVDDKDSAWMMAYETERLIGPVYALEGIMYEKIKELENYIQKEPTPVPASVSQ